MDDERALTLRAGSRSMGDHRDGGQKYAHLAPSHLNEHAGTIKFWSTLGDQKEKTPLEGVA